MLNELKHCFTETKVISFYILSSFIEYSSGGDGGEGSCLFDIKSVLIMCCISVCIDDEWINGWMAAWMDGWMDRQNECEQIRWCVYVMFQFIYSFH